jgi:hypothetical protein
MTDDHAIIEAAFNSLWTNTRVSDVVLSPTLLHTLAEKVTAAVAPLIRAAALEEAAKVAKDGYYSIPSREEFVAAIRALKEQP